MKLVQSQRRKGIARDVADNARRSGSRSGQGGALPSDSFDRQCAKRDERATHGV